MVEKIKSGIALMKSLGFMKFIILLTKKILKIPTYRPIVDFNDIEPFFKAKNGFEIGGPSNIFSSHGLLPIYNIMNSLDGVNFSAATVWTGSINEKHGFVIDNKSVGKQYIFDAVDCITIANNRYDFVLSSNNIEHIANPMRAIENWLSILKNDGVIVIVAPKKDNNFDHNRKTVQFDHLMHDYQNETTEDDLTHLDEILQLHDLRLDRPAGSFEQFKERSLKNIENRCLHHHVFDLNVLKKIYQYFKLSVIKEIEIESDYVIIGKK